MPENQGKCRKAMDGTRAAQTNGGARKIKV